MGGVGIVVVGMMVGGVLVVGGRLIGHASVPLGQVSTTTSGIGGSIFVGVFGGGTFGSSVFITSFLGGASCFFPLAGTGTTIPGTTKLLATVAIRAACQLPTAAICAAFVGSAVMAIPSNCCAVGEFGNGAAMAATTVAPNVA